MHKGVDVSHWFGWFKVVQDSKHENKSDIYIWRSCAQDVQSFWSNERNICMTFCNDQTFTKKHSDNGHGPKTVVKQTCSPCNYFILSQKGAKKALVAALRFQLQTSYDSQHNLYNFTASGGIARPVAVFGWILIILNLPFLSALVPTSNCVLRCCDLPSTISNRKSKPRWHQNSAIPVGLPSHLAGLYNIPNESRKKPLAFHCTCLLITMPT